MKAERLKKFGELCIEYDTLRAEARKKITDLIKIPVAPAAIVAGSVAMLAKLGVIDKEWGIAAVIADIAWALVKFSAALNMRNQALEKAENIISEVRLLLSTIDERDVLLARSLMDSSIEGLSIELAKGQKIEYKM